MAKYLLNFQIRIHNSANQRTAEQSEECLVDCEPEELLRAIGAEKKALAARVTAAVARFDPSASSSISLTQAIRL